MCCFSSRRRHTRCALVTGVQTCALPIYGRLVNRGFLIDDRGDIRARYDKIHLFDVDLPTGESWRESVAYARGTRGVAVEPPLGLMGLSICSDLRFPDLSRAPRNAGATTPRQQEKRRKGKDGGHKRTT